jgi:hypothetical protein
MTLASGAVIVTGRLSASNVELLIKISPVCFGAGDCDQSGGFW